MIFDQGAKGMNLGVEEVHLLAQLCERWLVVDHEYLWAGNLLCVCVSSAGDVLGSAAQTDTEKAIFSGIAHVWSVFVWFFKVLGIGLVICLVVPWLQDVTARLWNELKELRERRRRRHREEEEDRRWREEELRRRKNASRDRLLDEMFRIIRDSTRDGGAGGSQ